MRIDPAPRDIGRILDDTLVLYRDNFRTLALAALAVLFPIVLVASVSGGATYSLTFSQLAADLESGFAGGAGYAPSTATVLVTSLLQILYYVTLPIRFVASVWLASSIHRSTPDWMAGRGQTVREFLASGRPRVLTLAIARFLLYFISSFASGLASIIAIALGALVFALLAAGGPYGIIIGVALSAVVAIGGLLVYMLALSPFQAWGPAVVLENAGVGAGLSRSIALVKGRAWRTVGYWLGVWMVAQAFRAAVYAPGAIVMAQWLGPIVQDPSTASVAMPLWIAVVVGVSGAVAEVFVLPFERACWTQYYLDLRARGEGMDLVMRARELATRRV